MVNTAELAGGQLTGHNFLREAVLDQVDGHDKVVLLVATLLTLLALAAFPTSLLMRFGGWPDRLRTLGDSIGRAGFRTCLKINTKVSETCTNTNADVCTVLDIRVS